MASFRIRSVPFKEHRKVCRAVAVTSITRRFPSHTDCARSYKIFINHSHRQVVLRSRYRNYIHRWVSIIFLRLFVLIIVRLVYLGYFRAGSMISTCFDRFNISISFERYDEMHEKEDSADRTFRTSSFTGKRAKRSWYLRPNWFVRDSSVTL